MKFIIAMVLSAALLFNSSSVLAKDEGIGLLIEMLPWEEVNGILPKYSKFTVLDVETGKRFEVQRRAGNRHADVQPISAKDTKIMKEIYGGNWSWKRRAIIVIHGDQWIAASMHGMPHGAGALDNNFRGHFCIHFYGSKTHRKNSMDLAHTLMILKSAGKLKEYAGGANPEEVIHAYFAGIKQQDPKITSLFSLQKLDWPEIENLKIKKIEIPRNKNLNDEFTLEVPVEIEFLLEHSRKEVFKGLITLARFSHLDGWKVDSERFLQDSEDLFSINQD